MNEFVKKILDTNYGEYFIFYSFRSWIGCNLKGKLEIYQVFKNIESAKKVLDSKMKKEKLERSINKFEDFPTEILTMEMIKPCYKEYLVLNDKIYAYQYVKTIEEHKKTREKIIMRREVTRRDVVSPPF